MNAARHTKIKYFQSKSNGPRVFPNKPILSIGDIPLEPLERLNPAMFSPL
jgi:hypothetical protein